MIGDAIWVVNLVSATQELCAGPLAGHAATRQALLKALLALMANASKVMEQHREAWGLTGSREDKAVSIDRIPVETGRELTWFFQATLAYLQAVSAARAALRAGGQLAPDSYALPRLESGDRGFDPVQNYALHYTDSVLVTFPSGSPKTMRDD